MQAKNNLAPPQQGLSYQFEQHVVAEGIVASVAKWGDVPVIMTANQALAADGDREDDGALGDAIEFLREELSGGPALQKTVKASAEANGISYATLRRAKRKLGVKAEKGTEEQHGAWSWSLPGAWRLGE